MVFSMWKWFVHYRRSYMSNLWNILYHTLPSYAILLISVLRKFQL